MIELEKLNDESYQEIMDAARRKIALLSDEWTNLQEYDPGITVIELFAWLTAVQRNYLNEISEDSQKKFLTLLGINAQHNRPSHTMLEVSTAAQRHLLPSETKWRAGALVFENRLPQWISNSRICALHCWDGTQITIPQLSEHHIFSLFGETPQKGNWFELEFDHPFPHDMPYTLYMMPYLAPQYHRNPILEGQQFAPMAQLRWEYAVGEDWKPLQVLQDDTHAFLFAGAITLLTKEADDALIYKIRVTLEQAEYDFPPCVWAVHSNVVAVEQRDTLCRSEIFTVAQVQDATVELHSEVALYGQNLVYQYQNGAWYPCEAAVQPMVEQGKTRIQLPFTPTGADNDSALLVVSCDARGADMHLLANGTKISEQQVDLKFPNILYDSVALMVGERKNSEIGFHIWRKTEDFYSCDKHSRAYLLDCAARNIRFGNHECGMAPPKGSGNIRLLDLALTEGSGGNIQKGMIRRAELRSDVSVVQFLEARGGRLEEPFAERKNRCAELFTTQKRAVTAKDYEKMVRQTPGLLIRNVKALPGYATKENHLYPQAGAITIAVCGEGCVANRPLHSYMANIRQFIADKRLVNTNLMVCWPTYIGLTITGKIVVNFRGKQHVEQIERAIAHFVNRISAEMGTPLYYGELFGLLDTLETVSYVESLQLATTGDVQPRGIKDDVFVPQNGVYYIEKIAFDYVRSEIF